MNENNWRSRWTKEQLKAMLLEQHLFFRQRETGIEREQLYTIEGLKKRLYVIYSG
jgi:hypothetical protein